MPTATKEKPKASKKTKDGPVTVTKPAAKKAAAEAPKKSAKKTSVTLSARDAVLHVLTQGVPRTEVKAKAREYAKSQGAETSFKTFDVSFFLKHLESKGYTVTTKKDGTVKVSAPKGETKAKAEKSEPEAKPKKKAK